MIEIPKPKKNDDVFSYLKDNFYFFSFNLPSSISVFFPMTSSGIGFEIDEKERYIDEKIPLKKYMEALDAAVNKKDSILLDKILLVDNPDEIPEGAIL